MTLAEARATAWTWIGKLGAGTRAVSPGPSSARHMWLNPSFEPIVATTSCVRVEADAEPLLVLGGHLAAEVVDPGGDAVAVVPGVARGLAELVDDPRLGRVGRVAHAQVDDVDPGAALAVLQLVDLAEEVGGQPPDARARPRCRSARRRRDWSCGRSSRHRSSSRQTARTRRPMDPTAERPGRPARRLVVSLLRSSIPSRRRRRTTARAVFPPTRPGRGGDRLAEDSELPAPRFLRTSRLRASIFSRATRTTRRARIAPPSTPRHRTSGPSG